MSAQAATDASGGNPLQYWTTVTAVLAFILSFGRLAWDGIYGLKPRADVLVELFADPKEHSLVIDSGTMNLRLVITNSGFRAFSVRRVSLVGREGRTWKRVSPSFDSASQHAETDNLEGVFLAPGQVWTLSFAGKIDWLFASHLEVEIRPSRWWRRAIRRAMPHASRNARKWHRLVLRQLKSELHDFDVKDTGLDIFVGRKGTGVHFAPSIVVLKPSSVVGDATVTGTGDREIIATLVRLLPERLPKLFDPNVIEGGMGPRVRWSEKVRENAANQHYLGSEL